MPVHGGQQDQTQSRQRRVGVNALTEHGAVHIGHLKISKHHIKGFAGHRLVAQHVQRLVAAAGDIHRIAAML